MLAFYNTYSLYFGKDLLNRFSVRFSLEITLHKSEVTSVTLMLNNLIRKISEIIVKILT